MCVYYTDLSMRCVRGKPVWSVCVCQVQVFWSLQVWDGSHDSGRLDTEPAETERDRKQILKVLAAF